MNIKHSTLRHSFFFFVTQYTFYFILLVIMSSSNVTSNLIASVKSASSNLNRYVPIFIYIFGILGNILNMIVLGQRTLRVNPSAIFLLLSSVAGLICIVSGLTSRMMSGFVNDLTLTIGWICRLRNVVLYWSRTVCFCMIVSAAIDRWLSSSPDQHRRQMSTLKNARRSILLVLTYSCIINAPIIFCYEANLTGALRPCYGSTYVCRLLTDLLYAFGTTILPIICMTIVGLLTINNVHHIRSRVRTVTGTAVGYTRRGVAITQNEQRTRRKMDRNLLKMLLVQVVTLIFLTCPHAIQKVYSSFEPSPPSQSLEGAIQTFIFDFVTLLAFAASGIPFYIYTLAGGTSFRNTLFNVIKHMWPTLRCESIFKFS